MQDAHLERRGTKREVLFLRPRGGAVLLGAFVDFGSGWRWLSGAQILLRSHTRDGRLAATALRCGLGRGFFGRRIHVGGPDAVWSREVAHLG